MQELTMLATPPVTSLSAELRVASIPAITPKLSVQMKAILVIP